MRPTTRVSEMTRPTANAPERAAPRPLRVRRPRRRVFATSALFAVFASVNVVVWRLGAECPARALHQIGFDEHVDIAVEDAVDVADLLSRAVILDELVRVQHVAANLAAERDLLLGAADLIQLGLLLFQLEIVQPGLEHFHRRVTIAMLRTLV